MYAYVIAIVKKHIYREDFNTRHENGHRLLSSF